MSTTLNRSSFADPVSQRSVMASGQSIDTNGPSAEWMTLLKLEQPPTNLQSLSRSTRMIKRSMDLTGAIGLLVLMAPMMLLVGLLIALTSPGGVLFRQRRVGLNLRCRVERRRSLTRRFFHSQQERRNLVETDRRQLAAYGRPFMMYKFRTMRTDAENNGPQFAVEADPRVTWLGRFLRKSRFDELPQLWNVIRGEMSLVGPRPERPEFIEGLSEMIPDYLQRLGIKPGLTGVAQVVNGYDNELDGFRRKVMFDLLYLQNCCLKNDLKILFRTIWVVLSGKGAV